MLQAAIGLALVTMHTGSGYSGEPVQLTHDGRLKFSPVFFEQGDSLIYVELATPMLYRLMRLKLDSGTAEPLHPAAKTSEFEPAVSADGKVYAYLKTVGVLRVNLEIQEFGGASLGQVFPGSGFSGTRSPALSPDHANVAYSFGKGGRQQIYVARSDGKEPRTLTDSLGINNWPAYSPDGRDLVFGSSRDGDFEIYRMPSAGGDAIRLTHSPGQDIRPRFSPDGKQIAFTSHRDNNAEIYVMLADGSEPRRITHSPDRDDYPDWHPDGRRLVIVSERQGKHDLYLVTME